MALIDFDAAKAALVAFRDEYRESGCKKSAGIVERCIDRLFEVECVETGAPLTAERVCRTEAFFPRGVIGREVWYCGNCGIRIEKKDRFCRGCGRRFVNTSSVT